MLVAGTGDGAYRVTGLCETDETNVEKVLDAPRVERVRQFDAVTGVSAATKTGLYHSLDGIEWTDLQVPRKTVYAVGANPGSDRIYAGTRPTGVYVATSFSGDSTLGTAPPEWRELEGFLDLPSRAEWGVPRHDDVAQVRSLRTHPDSPRRIIAGVEPGGVHVSDDAGETWTERKAGVHDDVHALHVVGPSEYVAATGVGLYHTDDAGRSWTRLDETIEQRYFRTACTHDGVLYTSAARVPPNRWEDHDADPSLLECRDGHTLAVVESPRPDEVVVGWTEVDGTLVGATHRGTLLAKRTDGWTVVGDVPTPDGLYGRYVNLSWYEE
ncbi:WD40/YVTN/BNR-like repeat-containing protein [Halomicrococcus sp. NG-SE-24]|uniref:WD40/YVTN/BNR-like repeat-containing protein n=1 Tax=Halomicrococcus sp. NG-SE-24 TaxID=3436928 RepID=UPI003D96CAD7